MPKRISIMLDDDLVKKLREIQAKELKKMNQNVSFSKVINQTLKKEL